MSLDIEINEHIPRKLARRMLLVNIEAKNREKGFSVKLMTQALLVAS
jgi:hypothetical protein